MKYRNLGKTGIKVSKLCFGALTVGPLQKNFTPERGGEIIRAALASGINFIDTAQCYKTYEHIRAGLKGHSGDVVISSKTYAHTKEGAAAAVEEARAKLDRDVIDIFLIHETESIHTLRGHMEALDELYRLKARGVLRAVGASTHHVAGVLGVLELGLDVLHPLLNMTGLGIVDGKRADMEAACLRAHESGIGIFLMKALGGGNLQQRAEEALTYAYNLPFADSVAIGMQNESEIEENVFFVQNGHFSSNYYNNELIPRKILVENWCEGCGSCIGACKASALRLQGLRAVCEHRKCILCGYCSARCPVFAIKIV